MYQRCFKLLLDVSLRPRSAFRYCLQNPHQSQLQISGGRISPLLCPSWSLPRSGAADGETCSETGCEGSRPTPADQQKEARTPDRGIPATITCSHINCCAIIMFLVCRDNSSCGHPSLLHVAIQGLCHFTYFWKEFQF